MTVRQVLHIDLDAFFASVEQMLNPELRGLPVIVGGEPGARGVVASASYEARALGIKTAMPLSQAYRICPQAVFLPGRYHHYKAVSDQFRAVLADFSPFLEPFGLDEAWLDLTGFEPLYGPVRQTAQRIKDRVRDELGITASIGIATSKVVAKVASDREKPDGLVEVRPGGEADFLAPLPVRELPLVGGKTQAKLKQYGVTTIGQLASQPPALLRYLFGVMGIVLHRLANGQDASAVNPDEQAAKSVSRATTLAQDTLDRGILDPLLYYLSERVAAELRDMGRQACLSGRRLAWESRQARCVVLKLRYEDFTTISRHQTLPEPTDAHQDIYRSALALLDAALQQRRQPVRLIGVGAQAARRVDGGPQLRLWDQTSLKERLLNRALDDVRGRYGFLAVQQGRTFALKGSFPAEKQGLVLRTPSLSR